MTTIDVDVPANLETVNEEISTAAKAADRDVAAVNLVAVTKIHRIERIRPALLAGHRLFGENRVQEAEEKWPAMRAEFPDLRLHLIGPLQSNKVRKAVQLFDVIETVDRAKLARTLARVMAEEDRQLGIFVQVNTGGEPQKAGVLPQDAEALVEICRQECGLKVLGLMCIPPQDEEAALHFSLLRDLSKRLGLAHLSMGMSVDFPKAIAHGATYVRVGTAIFGQR
jgi:pyridoxal phosphate enzyme (YggS family)